MKEIRKLGTGQDEDYITGCLLDYDCIKIRYRLLVVDLSRQRGSANRTRWTIKQYWWYKWSQINETKIFSREHNDLIEDGKLWRSKN